MPSETRFRGRSRFFLLRVLQKRSDSASRASKTWIIPLVHPAGDGTAGAAIMIAARGYAARAHKIGKSSLL
jgi:hypothetical protein